MNNIKINDETVKKIKDVYQSNAEKLADLRENFDKYNDILSYCDSAEETFEQGYNNAIEYVCSLLGIEL